MDVFVFEDGAIRGGVLITDIETHPYEFHVTSPVKPTPFQQVLYGATLSDYIYNELIGLPLMNSVKEKTGILLIRDEHLLLIGTLVSFPIVSLQRDQSIIGDDRDKSRKPISVMTHHQYPDDETSFRTLERLMASPSRLAQHNLTEPFERVYIGLKEAHRQRLGEKANSSHG